MAEEPATLKESLFNPETIAGFADAIHATYPAFDRPSFLSGVLDETWDERPLMDRMRHVTTVLHRYLPGDYRKALDILFKAQPFIPRSGFITMVPSDYVAQYGLDDPDASIPALEVFTQPISSEFAVRPFIIRYPERMMAQMLVWSGHEHPGVRRLASEGCRPRLPWGMRLQNLVSDPSPILPILEMLKHDPDESVRRSVANNLNDISKDNPGIVVDVLRRWQAEEGDDPDIRWITGQALRTLVKAGDKDALELLGYPAEPSILVRNVRVEPARIVLGESVTLTYQVVSTGPEPQSLIVDYVVYLMRANGQQTPKVFKHKKVTLAPGETIEIKKKHGFQPVTTRRYYPGAHAIQPQINGLLFDRVEFEIVS